MVIYEDKLNHLAIITYPNTQVSISQPYTNLHNHRRGLDDRLTIQDYNYGCHSTSLHDKSSHSERDTNGRGQACFSESIFCKEYLEADYG